jgi:NADH dehydrogenase FAD-containing subunit
MCSVPTSAAGSVTNDFGNVTVRERAYSLKTLPDALGIRNAVMDALERARWAEDPERRLLRSCASSTRAKTR